VDGWMEGFSPKFLNEPFLCKTPSNPKAKILKLKCIFERFQLNTFNFAIVMFNLESDGKFIELALTVGYFCKPK
jgi:hypothetical protein